MKALAKVVLSFTVACSALSGTTAMAAPVCADTFSGKTLPRLTLLQPLEDLKDILNQVRASRFKPVNYDEALNLYRTTDVSQWIKPANREARLALLQVFSERSGSDPLAIEHTVKRFANNPSELRRLANSVGKLDPQKGFSSLQIESIFLKTYGYRFVSPLGSAKMKELGVQGVERELLRQWVDRELGTKSLADAAGAMGLLREPNAKETFIEWYRDRSRVTDFLAKGIVNVMSFYSRGLISPAQFSALGREKMTEEIRLALEAGGFDATYPILKKNFGQLASFDRRFFLSKRYFRTAAMAAILIYFYPGMVQTVMGPNYDASTKGYVQLTEDLGVYTAQVAERFYEIKIKGSGGVTTKVTVKPVLDPKDSLQLNDGMGPSSDPDPVPISRSGRDISGAQASATQKAITETESFNRQMDEAIAIVRGTPETSASSRQTQAGAAQGQHSQSKSADDYEAYSNSLDNVDFSEFAPKDS